MTHTPKEKAQNNTGSTEQETQQNTYQSSTKRIAKNTLMLYFRQMLILLVSLYTVRAVLEALGAQDYGIYNVVAGVVTMFGFLSGTMASASQRYFSWALGRGDTAMLEKTFGVTLGIYVLLIAVIFVLSQTVGLWFVLEKLVIPAQRKTAAVWVYEFAVVSFAITLITAPYMAAIIAHEDMGVYARVSIVEAALKLAAVFALQVIPCDRLAAYGGLLLAAALINTALYRAHCRRHYAECRFRLRWDRALFREMAAYSGWNLMGVLSGVLKSQGVNVLLNLFFGAVVNAARGIAFQVNSAVDSFANNFSSAVRPQIVKTYTAGNKWECFSLVYVGSRTCFYLQLVFSVPVILRSGELLGLWLKTVPEHTAVFTQLVMINALIDSLSYTLMALMSAHGRLMTYQLIVSSITLLNLPVSYVVLRAGCAPESTMFASIGISVCALSARIFALQYLTGMPSAEYARQVLLRIVPVSVLSFLPAGLINRLFGVSVLWTLTGCAAEAACTGVVIFFIGMTGSERKALYGKIFAFIKKGKLTNERT